ncbi:MAG: diguanylate cyclase [Planctomycetota bacterium]
MKGSSLTLVQPLQSLPSLLCMSDVRAALLARDSVSPSRADVEGLLEIDPLSTLRALRLASAPLWAPMRTPETVAEIVAALGTPAAQRLLDVPMVDVERTGTLRQLWLHSLATACAAEYLARISGAAVPAEGYLRGLLHDLGEWLEQLSRHHDGRRPEWCSTDLVESWGLPNTVTAPETDDNENLTPQTAGADPLTRLRLAPQDLIAAADGLATLAGFGHGDGDAAVAGIAGDELEDAATHVREAVAGRLARFGLSIESVRRASAVDGSAEPRPLFPGRTEANLPDLVARMLDCRDASNYAAANTLGTAAALRFLDFDRAFIVTWNREGRRVWVRSKSDLTELGLARRPLRPTDREIDTLEQCIARGEARMLVRGDPREGLCGALGADRALVAPLRTRQRLPSFLIVDRAPTTRLLDMDRDGAHACVLSGFLAMMVENIELRLRRRRAEHNATIDSLTGLANRGVGLFTLERHLAATRRGNAALCAMMIDLDEFKALNDNFGHLAGDHALRITAAVLRRTVRGSDTVCRYGGEEFLVILPDTEAQDATILATRLFTAVADAGREHGLPVTCSIGLSSARPDDTLDALVGRADGALYASKSRGRNRFSADTD